MPSKTENQKSKTSLTREGWLWLVAAGVLLLVGLYKGINLLTVLAYVMIACVGLSAFLARQVRGLRGVRWIGGPLFAGTPFPVEARLTNAGRLPRLGVQLDDEGPEGTAGWFVPSFPAGETLVFRRDVTLPRRGRYAWGRLRARSGYPFGLVEQTAEEAAAEDVIVLPRLGRLHRGRLRRYLAPVGLARVPPKANPRRHPTAQTEFHGLRAFRSGDSPRWIHWRTSARCGELMVREFEDVPTDNLVLIFDPWHPSSGVRGQGSGVRKERQAGPLTPAFEDALSLAATVCWEWCRQKGDRFVLAVAASEPAVLDGSTGPDHALRMLECLAVQEGEALPDGAAVGERLGALPLPAATVLLVSPREPAALQASLAQRLQRPVVVLGPEVIEDSDFYEKPALV